MEEPKSELFQYLDGVYPFVNDIQLESIPTSLIIRATEMDYIRLMLTKLSSYYIWCISLYWYLQLVYL